MEQVGSYAYHNHIREKQVIVTRVLHIYDLLRAHNITCSGLKAFFCQNKNRDRDAENWKKITGQYKSRFYNMVMIITQHDGDNGRQPVEFFTKSAAFEW